MPKSVNTKTSDKRTTESSESSLMASAGSIFWSALVVGMLLTSGGFVALNLALIGNTASLLVLCSGLGIIFGAFGSTSTVKYKGFVVTGVAAVAIFLLVLVDNLIKNDFVLLDIVGDVEGAEVVVIGHENYLGAARDRKHRFIVIAKEIPQPLVTVVIAFPSGREFIFECVHRDEIQNYLGSGQIIQWRFDRKNEELTISGDPPKRLAGVGPCPKAAFAPRYDKPVRNMLAALGAGIIPDARAAGPADIAKLLDDLESGSAFVRLRARSALAARGLDVIQPLLKLLAVDSVSYQTRLGVVVALARIVRANKNKRRTAIDLVTTLDLQRLVEAARDSDHTIQLYASEFLYDLGDVRVVPSLLKELDKADDNEKTDLLHLLNGVYPYLDKNQRAETTHALTIVRANVGSKTKQLIDEIIGKKSDSDGQYWIIVGSFTDRGAAQAYAKRINEENKSIGAFVGLKQPNNAYFPVIVGLYVSRSKAEKLIESALKLRSVREYGSAPYLSSFEKRK